MKITDPLVLEAQENPDWGFARTKRVALFKDNLSLVQSAYCVDFNGFKGPNRDYCTEGLLHGMEKYLDGLFYKATLNGETLRMDCEKIEAYPWKQVYFFKIYNDQKEWLLTASYMISKRSKNQSLIVEFKTNAPELGLKLKILSDFDDHDFEEYNLKYEGNIEISKKNKKMIITSRSFSNVNLEKKKQEWYYKLGWGYRRITEKGVEFEGCRRVLLDCGDVELKLKNNAHVDFFIQESSKTLPRFEERGEVMLYYKHIKPYNDLIKKAAKIWGEENALALAQRMENLINLIKPEGIAPAGGLWWHYPWYRDFFETAYTNFDFIYTLKKTALKNNIMESLNLEKNGLIPTSKKGELFFNSVDTTLLAYLTALEFAKRDKNEKMKNLVFEKIINFINRLKDGGQIKIKDGLIMCPADYSWMDATINGRPVRIPEEWEAEENYYLPEINALWIKLLSELEKFGKPEFKELKEKTLAEFKNKLMEKDFIPDLTSEKNGKSPIEGSGGIVALAILKDFFEQNEIEKMLERAEKIMVKRNEKTFGILCRNTGSEIYLNDGEYHGKTIWPRDTPYLIKLLEKAGKEKEIEEILLNALDHQQNESCVMYNSELFSQPNGRNPNENQTPESQNPVPVKNPIQLWSQWIQPYINHLKQIKTNDQHKNT